MLPNTYSMGLIELQIALSYICFQLSLKPLCRLHNIASPLLKIIKLLRHVLLKLTA